MRRFSTLVIGAAILLLVLASTASFALGYLKIHPSNPHYFQEDGTGRPVLIHSYWNLIPSDPLWDDIGQTDYWALRRRLNWFRVWHFFGFYDGGVFPFQFSTETDACEGVPYRFDLMTNNPNYWERLRNSFDNAALGGAYAELMIFDRCCMQWNWPTFFFNSGNSSNDLETDGCTGTWAPGFYQWSTKPHLKACQESYIKNLIDGTIQCPNVIYEIENEHTGASSSGWADHYAAFVKDYIEENYPNSPRLVTYNSIVSEADLDQAFNWSDIDVVQPHWFDEPEYDPTILNTYIEPRWSYNKAINVDEFGNGCANPDVMRTMCWTIISSGGHYKIEDAYEAARPAEVCENVRSFIAKSGWNFINCAPQKSLITSGGGYCMRNPGVEYMCYFPSGGSKTITLSAATYYERWWNPRTGGFYNLNSWSHGGGSKTLSTPDSNDWVLYLSTSALPTQVLTSKYATTSITVDGATNDWIPGQSKIRGGDTGTGNIGILDFDDDKVCYVGGNLDTGQKLPYNKTDHAVTVLSRYDSSYVYFMVRCNDDDMRYNYGTDQNYSNDCVEFFIDPSHNGGSTAMSSSTSDVQLVIDANNQVNVYNTTSGYKTQILGGVSSAVARDYTGWTLEVRLTKSVFDPDLPSTGTVGIDITVRDNDNNNDSSMTTYCAWADPEVSTSSYPTKIPNRWGDLNLETHSDSTAPSSVTNFTATAGTGQVELSWTNPSTADFTGTVIRYKTGGYPSSVTDGQLVVDKLGAPSSAGSYTHTGLTGGVTYYYSAYAHDEALNYASAATANATPSAVQVYWNTLVGDQFTVAGGRTPSIAVDSSGNVHMVYMLGNHVYYRVGNASLQFNAAEQIPDPPQGADYYLFPHLVLDANQVPHVVWGLSWGPDAHYVWYTNRIGGTWRTPECVISCPGDARANQPRLAVGGGFAYAACFGGPEGAPYWANGYIVRITNLSTTPTVARTAYLSLWNPHPYVKASGQLWFCGRGGATGHKYAQLDSYTLAGIGDVYELSNASDGITGEEFGACMDPNGVIHGAGVIGRFDYRESLIALWYNNAQRSGSYSAIIGLDGDTDWTNVDVVPGVAVDTASKVYLCFRRHETSEGWATRIINNNAYDTPVVFGANLASYPRYELSAVPTKTGGVYVAWEAYACAHVRSIGRGSDAPDTTPPGPVSNFTATAGSAQVALSWTNPSDQDFTGTMIRYKTDGYPASVTDGMLVIDKAGSPSASDNYTHAGLTPGVTYYYSAWSHDSVPNYTTTQRDASAVPTAPSISTVNTKDASNLNLVIDGATSDWSLGDFSTKSRGGQDEVGDYAIVGYDGGTWYYGGYNTSQALPTSAADHTAKVYSRHDQQYMYFLIRCDDSDMCYANGVDNCWANDCVEFYIDPGHDHGSSSISSSTSDLQLVIDCNNQKNVYMTTSGYKTQVLNGITSAVVRDGTGWTLEVQIAKSALDPDLPANGKFGVEFAFRDNDNYDGNPIAGEPAYSTMYGWRDNPSDTSYPHKVPDKWGDASLVTLAADTTPPASVTSFTATAGNGQVSLSWTNPQTTDWAGTMVRFKTSGYPTGPTDGTQIYNSTGASYTHTGLTNGTTYYYCAYAYDDVPNYASPAQANATPTGPTISTINTKTGANMNFVIDGATSDWSLGDFTTKSRGGQNEVGDYAIVGYDGGTCYYGGYNTSLVLPTSATDHTAKVYSRHCQQYLYFLIRCDDSDMCYANSEANCWANDCVEFYIDSGHDHGSTGLTHPGSSTSDLQLVIDCNNQRNVYCCTDTYKNQVLAGVTSAVVRDGTGWWLEMKIAKSAIDPDIPVNGTIGVEFAFRDNDNYDGDPIAGEPAYSTMYGWRDNPSDTSFPHKVPDKWGDASLVTLAADTTPPAAVTGFTATAGTQQVSLSWTNPQTADYSGTMIRFKTGGYPTGPTDGTEIYKSTGTSCTHTGLTAGVTYYYCAYAYDDVPNYASAAQANATPTGATISTVNTKSAANMNLVIDGTTSDWTLGDFTTKSLGGQNQQGDYAIVGYDAGTCYYGGYWTNGVLPTSASDHTAKVYSRHDQQYMLFLIRCDDDQMNYANAQSANWANDCVEFYIDPGHDHGSVGLTHPGSSTSDLQLVIDCNNQKNVYCTTSGYATQVLNGVTSAVVRDGTGYWMEVKILKSAVDPDLPASGSFGVDFCFRDNDNPDSTYYAGSPAYSTMYSWRDNPSGAGFPTKVPNVWGDASLASLSADTTAPASVTGFSATGGSLQVSLGWTNPQTHDWTGTQVRFKTTGYPTGPTDGTQIYNGTGTSYTHTGLTGGTTYYYCAYAYDDVPNYASAAQANATPTGGGPYTISNSTFNSDADGWTISTWKAHPTLYQPGTMAWASSGGNPNGCMQSTGSGSTDNDSRCLREGGEIKKTISTVGYSDIKVYYDLKVNSLGNNYTGSGSYDCTVDHNLIDEQITVFYSTNGGTNWTEAEYLTRSTLLGSYQSYGTRTIDLTSVSACDNNANFAVRFRWQFNTASDTGWLDNIKVEAQN